MRGLLGRYYYYFATASGGERDGQKKIIASFLPPSLPYTHTLRLSKVT